ncbi:MAG: hypothetical protein KKH04_10020 [Proteobacteria bacterium]|nr:hypothetical protein [Pseudomonadota bacterium]
MQNVLNDSNARSARTSQLAASRNLKRAAVRSFFAWCIGSELLHRNPAKMIRMEKEIQRETRYLNLKEVERFKKAI